MDIEKYVREFLCLNLHLETYGLYHFMYQFFICDKNFLVPLDHFY